MNATTTDVLSLDNPVFSVYLICCCLLVLKMMGITLLTIFYRFKTKTFISEEDATWAKGEVVADPDVERMRRAHLNDLENIPMFFAAGFAYLWVEPNVPFAFILYISFTIARTLHTLVYTLIVIRQPARALLFMVGMAITAYMAIHAALHVFIYLVK